MKAGFEHRVPLADRALAIVHKAAETKSSQFVFAGRKNERPLFDTALAIMLRRAGLDVTVHGFRSAFRDWCGERTAFSREIAEAALAHAVGDKTERAYRRGDALEKRRRLMEAWASYCSKPAGGKVVSIRAGG